MLRKAPATSAAALNRKSSAINKEVPMHRGRKKRVEAKQRLAAKKNFVHEELQRLEHEAQKKREQLKRDQKRKSPVGPALSVFGDMANALPVTKDDSSDDDDGGRKEQGPKVLRHRERRRIVVEETEQAKNVREHAAFKSDPIEALRQHLMNTVSSNPCEVAPRLATGAAGAAKKRGRGKGKRDEKTWEKTTVGRQLVAMPSKEGMEKIKADARERVAMKKAEKAELAEAALKLKKRRKGDKIEKQSLGSLLARPSRGRIGVKRAKI